jgi:hypothetical protein
MDFNTSPEIQIWFPTDNFFSVSYAKILKCHRVVFHWLGDRPDDLDLINQDQSPFTVNQSYKNNDIE